MKVAIFFTIVLLLCCASAKYERYQVWRVRPTTEKQMKWLNYIRVHMSDKFDFWTNVPKMAGHPVDIMVGPDHQDTLRMFLMKENSSFDVMIDDVNKLVTNQMTDILARIDREKSDTTPLGDFNYDVYHPYEEIQQWVADMTNEYSDIIKPFVLGESYEGRKINGFRIRGVGSSTQNPPGVWFEGGIHAREWIAPATVMGFTKKLLDDYRNGDELVVEMFDNIDWYIIPSLNVDGYSYTWTDDRMWRKTRSPNKGSHCIGTDPNRNWPYKWGGAGASDDPCSNEYRGSKPSSEIEVKHVIRFLKQRKSSGQDFMVFIDWHSYSQLIIAPWGYKETNPRTKDYNEQMALAAAMSSAIKDVHGMEYQYGAGAEILYANAGSSKDWGYANYTRSKNIKKGGLEAIYSYTVELRDTGEYGFLLPEDQIRPTYEEIYAAVRELGAYLLNKLSDH